MQQPPKTDVSKQGQEDKTIRVMHAGADGKLRVVRLNNAVTPVAGEKAAASWSKATCSWSKATC
jgi:hypothetical protein